MSLSCVTAKLSRRLAGLSLHSKQATVRRAHWLASHWDAPMNMKTQPSTSRQITIPSLSSACTLRFPSIVNCKRPLSSTTTTTTTTTTAGNTAASTEPLEGPPTATPTAPTFTTPQIVHTEDGRRFAAFDMRRHPKLKPHIVKRRLDRMRTYAGKEKNIRHSPWKLNLICQLVAGLPLNDAITQLEFSDKSRAPLVQKVLRRTANVADIQDGLQPTQLEVAECFATKGRPLKRIKPMGRGRFGRMERKHAHMRVILREIDFKLRIYQAPSVNQKKKWYIMQQQAERDGARAQAERKEVARLEREAAAAQNKKK